MLGLLILIMRNKVMEKKFLRQNKMCTIVNDCLWTLGIVVFEQKFE